MRNPSFIILILLTCLSAGSVLTQENSYQGENYGQKDFSGKSVSLNLVNTGLKDILKKFTAQAGCKFRFDRSVKISPLNVEVKEGSWNIHLDAILNSQNLTSTGYG